MHHPCVRLHRDNSFWILKDRKIEKSGGLDFGEEMESCINKNVSDINDNESNQLEQSSRLDSIIDSLNWFMNQMCRT
jgi:hypothetical protein